MKSKLSIAAAATVLIASTASAAVAFRGGHVQRRECDWGASSVTATYEHGRWVESQPVVSGCVPNP
jgi:hypothetical protein